MDLFLQDCHGIRPGQRKHEWFTNVVDIQISSILPCHKTIWKKPPQQLTKVVYYLPRHVHILDATFWTFHGWGCQVLDTDVIQKNMIQYLDSKFFNVGHSSAWYQTTISSAAHLVPSWSFPSDLADGWTSAATVHEKPLETIRGGEFSLLQLQSVEVRRGICFKRTGSTTHNHRICNSYRFQSVNQSGISRIGHSFLWGGTTLRGFAPHKQELTAHQWHSCPPHNPRSLLFLCESPGHVFCYPPMAQRYPHAFGILCTSYLNSDVKCGCSLVI